MPDNPNEPRPFDAVLGGQSRPPVNAAVLGGLAGVKQRLASTSDEVRIAALYEALKYGQAGLDVDRPLVSFFTLIYWQEER
ncbi:hypothetical protein [Microseira sp. BLCC-F43]|jgi:hypothetical protein|uniref:hypothetical protein n=1 Tax=Microseira sp. BLCC-F43 TaxID=3153602 RepID=UPI0035BA6DAD